MNDWIIQGAIIGVIIGALMGLAGDPLIELIDSLIGGSRTSSSEETISSTDDREYVEQLLDEGKKEVDAVKTEIESTVERLKREIRRECPGMFQKHNQLCQWFRDNRNRKLELDKWHDRIEEAGSQAHKTIDRARWWVKVREGIRGGAYGVGFAGFIISGMEFFGLGEGCLILLSLEGMHALSAYVDIFEHAKGWRSDAFPEDAQLAELDKGDQMVDEFRRQKSDEYNNRVRELKSEFLKNCDKLHELERLMRDAKCENIPPPCGWVNERGWLW